MRLARRLDRGDVVGTPAVADTCGVQVAGSGGDGSETPAIASSSVSRKVSLSTVVKRLAAGTESSTSFISLESIRSTGKDN